EDDEEDGDRRELDREASLGKGDGVLAALERLQLHPREPLGRDQRRDSDQGAGDERRDGKYHEDRDVVHRLSTRSRWDTHRGLGLPFGVIRRAYERSGLDVSEPDRPTYLCQLGELLGSVVSRNREVPRRWPQILSERQDVHIRIAEVG